MRRTPRPFLAALSFAACLALAPLTGAAQPSPDSSREALLASVLRATVDPNPQDQRSDSLRALRDLRDDSLRPFFGHLAAQRDRVLRTHGIFALAEFEDPPRVNTQLLAKIDSSSEQAAIIGRAISLGYLDDGDIAEILRWSSHAPFVELVLMARQHETLTVRANHERLAELTESEIPQVAILAQVVLIHINQDPERIESVVAQLEDSSNVARLATLAILLSTIRENELNGVGPLLLAIADRFRDDSRVRHDAIGTLLLVDPQAAKGVWSREFNDTTSLASMLRLALHALAASESLDVDFFRGVQAGSENALVQKLIEAARANAAGDISDSLFRELVDLGHRAAMLWVIEQTPDLADARAVPILVYALDRGLAREDRRSPVNPAFAEAAAALAERDPSALLDPLTRANSSRDTPATEAILAAMLREASDLAWSEGESPTWHDNRAEALAIILVARTRPESLAHADRLDELERVALGYGALPHLFRVQAAWLALKARGDARRVIAQLMTETG